MDIPFLLPQERLLIPADIQYVMNRGGTHKLDNALVVISLIFVWAAARETKGKILEEM